jgi:hypothetical protein
LNSIGIESSAVTQEAAVADERKTSRVMRLLVEGLVILFSILAAFFLEGWRADRELARELRQELVNVGVELERNRTIVQAELNAIGRIIAGADYLLERLEAEPEARFVSVTDSIAWLATLWGPTLDPSLGAVDALISSGRLAQIENPELRLRLAGLRDMIIDAQEEEDVALKISLEQLSPRIVESPGWPALRRLTREFTTVRQVAGLSPQEQMAGGRMPTYGDIAVPNNAAVRGVLNLRLIWYEAAIAELRPLLPHLEGLEALVDRETG